MITPFATTPKRGRGRPPKPEIDPRLLDVLTIPEALAYIRSTGRSLGRKKLLVAIVTGALAASVDGLHNDRFGRPLMLLAKSDVNTWLAATLKPFRPTPLPRVASL